MVKIDEWFNENFFLRFRKFCQKYNLIYLEDLQQINFGDLVFDIDFVGKYNTTIKQRFQGFTDKTINKQKTKNYELNPFITDINNISEKQYINNVLLIIINPIDKQKKEEKELREFKNRFIYSNITEKNLDLLLLFSSKKFSIAKASELHDSYCSNYLLENLSLKDRTGNILKIFKLTTIGELLFYKPSELKKIKNCGLITIKDLQNSLKEFLLTQDVDFSKNWFDFESMITSVLTLKKRDLGILKYRIGLDLENKQTLESVGKKFNLTRERIRQIISIIIKKISNQNVKLKIEPFWIAIELVLEQNIGLISSKELSNKINAILEWKNKIEHHSLFQFIKMFDRFICENDYKLIGLKQNKCINCERIYKAITDLSKIKDKTLFIEVPEIIKKECCSKFCLESTEEKIISLDFVKYIIQNNNSEVNQIIYDDEFIYNSEYWEKQNYSLSDKIADILLKLRAPKHITEILNSAKHLLNGNLGKNEISNLLKRHKDVILWDRGTFIHKKNINVSDDFIYEINNYCISRLRTSLPFLCVSGIYDKFKKKCLYHSIPSYTALYSLLRDFNDNELVFPYYPTIFLTENYSGRIQISSFVEDYLLRQNKPISFIEFKKYFQNDIGIKSYSLQQICANSNVITKENNNTITHINFSTSPVSESVLHLKRKSIKQASNKTNYFKNILFESKEIIEIENQTNKYYSFFTAKGKIFVPVFLSDLEKNTLKYKLYEKILDIRYDNDPKNPGKSLISWESQLIIEPDWKQVSDDIFYAEYSFGKVIVCNNSKIGDTDILEKISSIISTKFSQIDFTFVDNLQLSENQKKIIEFITNNTNTVSHLKLNLFCRQHKIQFPQILNSINEKSNHFYDANLIASKDRKLFFNEKFLK